MKHLAQCLAHGFWERRNVICLALISKGGCSWIDVSQTSDYDQLVDCKLNGFSGLFFFFLNRKDEHTSQEANASTISKTSISIKFNLNSH